MWTKWIEGSDKTESPNNKWFLITRRAQSSRGKKVNSMRNFWNLENAKQSKISKKKSRSGVNKRLRFLGLISDWDIHVVFFRTHTIWSSFVVEFQIQKIPILLGQILSVATVTAKLPENSKYHRKLSKCQNILTKLLIFLLRVSLAAEEHMKVQDDLNALNRWLL